MLFFLLRLSFIYLFFFLERGFFDPAFVSGQSFFFPSLSFFSVSVGIVYVSCAKASEPRIVSSPFFLYIHLCLVFIPISLLFSHSLSLSFFSFFLPFFPHPFFFLDCLVSPCEKRLARNHVTLSILPVFWIYLCTFLYSPNPLLEVVPSSSSRLGLYIAQNEVA